MQHIATVVLSGEFALGFLVASSVAVVCEVCSKVWERKGDQTSADLGRPIRLRKGFYYLIRAKDQMLAENKNEHHSTDGFPLQAPASPVHRKSV